MTYLLPAILQLPAVLCHLLCHIYCLLYYSCLQCCVTCYVIFIACYITAACTAVSPVTDGSVTVQSNGSHTWAVYSCDLGYSLAGVSVLTCLAGGSWDFTTPSCGMQLRFLLLFVHFNY